MAPEAVTGGVNARLTLLCGWAYCAIALATGCGSRSADVGIVWTIEPSALVAGSTATVALTLTPTNGAPASGATIRLEAHMSHPGMTPVVADAVDRGRGAYEAQLQFTMAGDWMLVASGTLADGRRMTKETRVSVRPAAGTAPSR
jgi:hypothetical protein